MRFVFALVVFILNKALRSYGHADKVFEIVKKLYSLFPPVMRTKTMLSKFV